MIIDDYRNAIKARLDDDTFFSTATAVQILAERRRTIRRATQDALSTRGVVGVVGMPRWSKDFSQVFNEYVFESEVEFYENPLMIETIADGRDGMACIVEAGARLDGYVIPITQGSEVVNPWSALQIHFGGFAGEKDATGIYRLSLRSRIYINNIGAILADQAGAWLVTEDGVPISAE